MKDELIQLKNVVVNPYTWLFYKVTTVPINFRMTFSVTQIWQEERWTDTTKERSSKSQHLIILQGYYRAD